MYQHHMIIVQHRHIIYPKCWCYLSGSFLWIRRLDSV